MRANMVSTLATEAQRRLSSLAAVLHWSGVTN
jgi:hypothetical protein